MTDRPDHRRSPRSGRDEPSPTDGTVPEPGADADAVAVTATDDGTKRGE